MKQPSLFTDEVTETEVTPAELKLTQTLIDTFFRKAPRLEDYKDTYLDKMTQLVEAKVNHQETIAPPDAEERPVTNLMDALRKSVAVAKKRASPRIVQKAVISRKKGTASPKILPHPSRRKSG